MIDTQTTPLTEHYYCFDSETVKTDTLLPEFLSDLGTIVLKPIKEPTVDQFESFESLGETVVNISGLWFQLSCI